MFEGNPIEFSSLVTYYKMGTGKCKDCDKYYWRCTCEGSRQEEGYHCEECELNRCLCDYEIRRYQSKEDVRLGIVKWIDDNLTKEDKIIILDLLKSQVSPNTTIYKELQNAKSIKTFVKYWNS